MSPSKTITAKLRGVGYVPSEVGSVLDPTRRPLEPVREVVRGRALVQDRRVVRREADVVEVLGRQQAEVLERPDLLVAEEAEVAAHAGAVEERRERVARELGRGREAGEARRQARRRPPAEARRQARRRGRRRRRGEGAARSRSSAAARSRRRRASISSASRDAARALAKSSSTCA